MSKERHWRELNPSDYLGAWDFEPGEQKQVRIKKMEQKKIAELAGATKSVMTVEGLKPIMMNSTNLKRIEKVLGTADYTKWIGQEIILGTERVQSVKDKEMVDAIRVVREKPVAKKAAIPAERWPAALKAVSSGEMTAQALRDSRELTAEQLAELDALGKAT